MTTLNLELVSRLESQANGATKALTAALAEMRGTPSVILSYVFMKDYEMRRAASGDVNATALVLDSIHHAAWVEFFREHSASNLAASAGRMTHKWAAMHAYTFCDAEKRRYYGETKSLIPFTAEAAEKFHADHLSGTPENLKAWASEILGRSGADYKNTQASFKTRMTIRHYDNYGAACEELGRMAYAAAHLTGVSFTFSEFYTNIRNIRSAEAITPIEGLGVTIVRRANGNATLILTKDVAALLNKAIGAV